MRPPPFFAFIIESHTDVTVHMIHFIVLYSVPHCEPSECGYLQVPIGFLALRHKRSEGATMPACQY